MYLLVHKYTICSGLQEFLFMKAKENPCLSVCFYTPPAGTSTYSSRISYCKKPPSQADHLRRSFAQLFARQILAASRVSWRTKLLHTQHDVRTLHTAAHPADCTRALGRCYLPCTWTCRVSCLVSTQPRCHTAKCTGITWSTETITF